MNKTIKKLKNQRGSALLLTLGILSLVLIMAMSFAFSARTTRQVAKVNADQVKARLLAESALERVLAAMKMNYNGVAYPPQNAPGFAFSDAALGASGSQKYIISTDTGSDTYNQLNECYTYLPVLRNFTSLPAPKYQLIDVGGETIGRVAFLVLEEANKLDINQMLTLQYSIAPPSLNQKFLTKAPYIKANEDAFVSLFRNEPFYADANPSLTPPPGPSDPPHHDFFYNLFGNNQVDDIESVDYTPTYSPSWHFENAKVRMGLTMQEIRVAPYYFLALNGGWYTLPPAIKVLTKNKWFSYKHIGERLGNYDNVSDPGGMWWKQVASTSDPYYCDPAENYLYYDCLKYSFFSGEDIEAYWDGIERQRFDITSYEWRNIDYSTDFYVKDTSTSPPTYTVDPTKSGWQHPAPSGTTAEQKSQYARDLVEALCAASSRPEFFAGTGPAPVARVGIDTTDNSAEFPVTPPPSSSTPIFGIPYLNSLGTVGKQIAANMVDFCDDDDFPTYPDSTDWGQQSEPEYFGNEKMAYINEVALAFTATRTLTAPYDVTLRVTPSVEFYNFFDDNDTLAGAVVLEIHGIGHKRINGGPATPISISPSASLPSGSFTINTSGTPVDVPSDIQDFASFSLSDFELDSSSPVPGTPLVLPLVGEAPPPLIHYQITINKIVVKRQVNAGSAELYDFAYWEGNWGFDTATDASISFLTSPILPTAAIYASLEAKDPRCNHRDEAWEWKQDQSVLPDIRHYYTNITVSNTLGAINTNFDPFDDTGCDSESGSTYSTAFIPNRPFSSMWELGAIHRGEPYRTLDLAGTDRAILDQVKIGPLKRTRGKFNLNSYNSAAIADLVSNINVNVGYEGASSGEGTTSFTPTAMASPSFSRGDCAAVLSFNPATGATDRQREAFIGRTANLLTTRMDKYTVLVVGEALKRIELPPGLTVTNGDSVWKTFVNPVQITIAGTPTWFSILGKQKMLAHIVRDAWRNEYEIVQMQLLED